MDFIIVYLADG